MVGPHVSITEAVRLDCLIGRWPKVKQQKRENNRAQRRRIPSVTLSSIFFFLKIPVIQTMVDSAFDGPQRWLSSLWLSHMTCQTPLGEPLNSSAWNKVIELVHLSKTTNKKNNASAGRLR